jgi:hypothetical protein
MQVHQWDKDIESSNDNAFEVQDSQEAGWNTQINLQYLDQGILHPNSALTDR